MRLLKVVAVCLLTLALTGCWSQRELTEVALVGLIGIDWVDNQYLVTINILTPRRAGIAEGGGGVQGTKPNWTLSNSAQSLDQAVSELDRMTSRTLTLEHLRTVVFGEAMARRGIGPTMDFMLRTVEIRPTVWLAVTPGLARDLLTARPTIDASPGDGPLGEQDDANTRSSITPAIRLVEGARVLQEEGIDLALPVFRLGDRPHPAPDGELKPDPSNAKEVIYGGVGLFQDDHLVDWLSPIQTTGLLWTVQKSKRSTVSASCDGGEHSAVFHLRGTKGQVNAWLERGQPAGAITVSVYAELGELTCKDLIKNGDATGLEALLGAEVKREISEALAIARGGGADVFGFGAVIFRQAPAAFTRMQPDWPERLANMPVRVEVKARVVRYEQLKRPYQWKPETPSDQAGASDQFLAQPA